MGVVVEGGQGQSFCCDGEGGRLFARDQKRVRSRARRASVTSYMDIFVGCVQSKRIRNLNLGKLARSKHFLSFPTPETAGIQQT